MASRSVSRAADREQARANRVGRVRLWMKSFIPADIEGAEPVPAGPHAGKTMLPSPGPIEAWFLTDQRGFSDDPNATARMHSEIDVDFERYAVVREFHHCDPTIQVDHQTGEEDCNESAGTEAMAYRDIEMAPERRTISMHLRGSSKNACLKLGPVKVSPSLDYAMDILLRLAPDGRSVTVEVDGQIETYPAFEMYVSVNGGTPYTVFQAPVEPGATPADLVGPGTRAVRTSVTVPAQPAT